MSKTTKISNKMVAKIPTKGNDVTTLGTNTVATSNLQDLVVTTNKLADAGVSAAKLNADTIPYLLKHAKNYIVNGDMRISQRGTNFSGIADNIYSLDRWHYSKSSTAVHEIIQDTDVPTLAQAGYLFQNSLRMNLQTQDTSIAAGDFVLINQKIEGYNFANIAQKAFTVSFWVKATATGIYCVSMRNSSGDRSYVAEYTVNASATWEYKTITVVASPSAGTWNYANGVGLQLFWTIASGSTFQTTAGSWQTGTFFGTSNQVNGVNAGANDFRITGVMVNEGSVAAPFRPMGNSFQEELSICQRYFYRFTGDFYGHGAGTSVRGTIPLKVSMRTSPSITRNGSLGGANFQYEVNGVGASGTISSVNFLTPGPESVLTEILFSVAPNFTQAGRIRAIGDSSLDISAEL